MGWAVRFAELIRELSTTRGVTVRRAGIGPPTAPHVLAAARRVAGSAWPPGMTELYTELSHVHVEYEVAGSGGNGGSISIPTVSDVWDHAAHEDELWFDWLVEENPDHPFTRIRPIDRFVPEAYAVLSPVPVPGDAPATVHYHYCGEDLIPTGLSYLEWLDALLRSRGALYWLSLTTGPRSGRTWVDENLDRVAALFPGFEPARLSPAIARAPIVA